MARNRFITPKTCRLELSDGDWVEIKDELNVGDIKRLEGVGLKAPVAVEGKVFSPIDWAIYEIERMSVYLLEWSFRDEEDRPKEYQGIDSIKALDPDTFREISNAINKHIKAKQDEKALAKKLKATGGVASQPTPNSLPTSPAPEGEQT